MKIYFAGMEIAYSSYGYVPEPEDNVFCTYFYRKQTDKFLKDINIQNHKGLITIDSGAHSFFGYLENVAAAHQKKKGKDEMPCPHEYFSKYLNWIKNNYDKISYFAELDIGEIVGLDQVKEWRNVLKEHGVYDKCITVMHSNMTWADFIELLDDSESKYIALEGLRGKKVNLPYSKMLKECYERKISVHGFALTSDTIVKKYPFTTVDSTTWTSIIRYGSLLVFDGKSLKQVKPNKENHMKYKVSVDFNNKNRSKEVSLDKISFSADQTRKFQRYITKLWEERGIKWH